MCIYICVYIYIYASKDTRNVHLPRLCSPLASPKRYREVEEMKVMTRLHDAAFSVGLMSPFWQAAGWQEKDGQ